MASKVFSCSFTGLECRIIEVQADISNGLPAFSIVGLGDASVQESRERVRSSIKNSGAHFPQTKKTINLAPAEVRKQGSLFDLPIAISILLADGQISQKRISNSIFIGELSLTGKVKGINGTIAITQHAKEKGFEKIFLPKENALEASFIDGIEIYPVDDLREIIEFCEGRKRLELYPTSEILKFRDKESQALSLTSIVGLEKAKRALTISAAGGHNALLYGSPGCGKTILCRAIQSLLSDMSKNEVLETTKIFSIAGMLNNENPLVTKRPFREIHHTASVASIIGGGTNPKPGEISLAHNGILFFDEIAEFPKNALEALRQPLEDKYINISRVHSSFRFPCNFTLIATMNPCPCGYKGDRKIRCICSENQIRNYQKKISGPLMDRFDMFLEIVKTPAKNIFIEPDPQNEIEKINSIKLARKIQIERFACLSGRQAGQKNINKNADMDLSEIKKFCELSDSNKKFLNEAAEQLKLSNRGYLKIIKLARTIADLENQPQIKHYHLAEAVQYRKQN